MITSGRGKYKVWMQRHLLGSERVFFIGGGQRSHIGGVVIAEPGNKPQVIRLTGHYDDVVLTPIATAAVAKYKTKVVVIGGVHVNNATKKEIGLLVENCARLVKKV